MTEEPGGLQSMGLQRVAVPSTPERREGLRACYWEGPSELPERRSSSSAPRRDSVSLALEGKIGLPRANTRGPAPNPSQHQSLFQ